MGKVKSQTRPGPAVAPAGRPAKKPARKGRGTALSSSSPTPPEPLFPVVGIGASAGGLEALEEFLRHVPEGSGMAFVIVQHLDPTRKGIMVELLQRATPMPVVQVRDRQRVEPDRVYVIPPNKDLSILHGVLHLLAPMAPRGLRLPIDFFLRSLAEDWQERSVGVILSGMGTDGTLGLRAIKERAGAVFVQDPASAKFDGMPRSAIDSGLADVVAPAGELPARIAAYLLHLPLGTRPGLVLEEQAQSALEKIIIILRAQTGQDFSLYKKSTVYRRVERRMGLHQLGRIADYVRFLRENPQETELLFSELLIGVTSFFREPAAWEELGREVIPALLTTRPGGGVLRAWVPGCSTGEEAYSLAIVFREALQEARPSVGYSLQVFATDLDRSAIDRARQGIYPANIAADVSPERLRRYFAEDERGYRVGKEIRESVIFAPQNLAMDPPFTKLDLLSCRNLLIYLAPELQRKLVPLFHYSLNPGGILLLGSAETIGAHTDLFAPLGGKARLYRRLDGVPGPPEVMFPTAGEPPRHQTGEPRPEARRGVPSLQSLADQVLLQQFAPAAVLVTAKGDILYISGRTGKYLEPAAGKANWNILAMAREGLRLELHDAFFRAAREGGTATLRGVKVGNNGGTQAVDVTVQVLSDPEPLRGLVMVVFAEVATPVQTPVPARSRGRAGAARVTQLEQELRQIREEAQVTREGMQASQEELRSTNEELQSANEELQSTNEELTTSKEEMQSLNEELQTVNQELQAKVSELSRVGSDMRNLLDSTEIAVLFLDDGLLVRRFTTPTTRLIKLIPGDLGRPITDIATGLQYPDLAADAGQVLRTLVPVEKPVPTGDGGWFTVRIMPYRTLENTIDGVVITFADITAAKQLEATLRQAASDGMRTP